MQLSIILFVGQTIGFFFNIQLKFRSDIIFFFLIILIRYEKIIYFKKLFII